MDLESTQRFEGKVVLGRRMGESLEIYSVNLDGSDLQELTDDSGRDLDPAQSPGGSETSYLGYRMGEK